MSTTGTEAMHHRPCVGGAEVDAFSPKSKRAMKWNHGARAKVKLGARQRERRSTRQALTSYRTV